MLTKIVGILNITPDSFSDGGKFNSFDDALNHLKQMLEEGADMIDIGAESTRPGFTPVEEKEEWRRLEKILPEIIFEVKKFNQKTAKKSHKLGVDIINDVDGLIDDRTVELIAKKNITTILMHNLPVPEVKGALINKHINLTNEIIKWAQEKISYLEKKGVKKSQLIFDVGIGFGKDALQSIRILKNIDAFRILGLPLYVGHSKKSFLDAINFSDFHLPNENYDKAKKTLIVSKYLAKKNVDFIRVHDVKETLIFFD